MTMVEGMCSRAITTTRDDGASGGVRTLCAHVVAQLPPPRGEAHRAAPRALVAAARPSGRKRPERAAGNERLGTPCETHP